MLEDDPFAEFEKQFSDLDLSDTVNYKALTDIEVLDHFSDVRTRLLDLGEMMEPKTVEGRELHSKRVALLVIIRERGIG